MGLYQFLDACRNYNQGQLSFDTLVDKTVFFGFNNVIDAFHVVNQGDIPTRFFIDQRAGSSSKGILLTDELFRLKESFQYQNLSFENEARWRLVEKAWELGLSPKLLEVRYYDEEDFVYQAPEDSSEMLEQHQLYIELPDDRRLVGQVKKKRRISLTSCRDALNGYQKGKCFYCFADISIDPASPFLAEVDHFFPHTLMTLPVSDRITVNLNGIWNLVLACQNCNRGQDGKSARIPEQRYLERLHKRNNFLVDSHHPLRETIMNQSGSNEAERRTFLRNRSRGCL